MKRIITLEEAIRSHPNSMARQVIFEGLETDLLTGINNLRGFERRLREAASFTKRHGIPFSLALTDLHGLSKYNNEHSYEHGNEALRRFANFLQESAREEDYVARIGGDEFGIILPGMLRAQHSEYLTRLRFLAREIPRVVTNMPFIAYWGITEYQGQPLELLKAEADKKLIEDKKLIKIFLEK